MPIIDFRARPPTPEYLRALDLPLTQTVMRKLGSTRPRPQTLEEWMTDLERRDVRRVVFAGRQSAATSANDVTNDYVADVMRRFPDRVVGIAGVDPMLGMAAVREATRAVAELGLRGVALDPYGGNTAANDRRLYPVYAKCAELNVPVIVTTGPLPFAGPRLAHGDVKPLDDVACDFPELTIVIDHTGWPWVQETIALAFRHENVFIDTSFYIHLPGTALLAEAANTIIPDRVLFASGFPAVSIETALERVAALPFTPEALEGVLFRNAERLLKKFGVGEATTL